IPAFAPTIPRFRLGGPDAGVFLSDLNVSAISVYEGHFFAPFEVTDTAGEPWALFGNRIVHITDKAVDIKADYDEATADQKISYGDETPMVAKNGNIRLITKPHFFSYWESDLVKQADGTVVRSRGRGVISNVDTASMLFSPPHTERFLGVIGTEVRWCDFDRPADHLVFAGNIPVAPGNAAGFTSGDEVILIVENSGVYEVTETSATATFYRGSFAVRAPGFPCDGVGLCYTGALQAVPTPFDQYPHGALMLSGEGGNT